MTKSEKPEANSDKSNTSFTDISTETNSLTSLSENSNPSENNRRAFITGALAATAGVVAAGALGSKKAEALTINSANFSFTYSSTEWGIQDVSGSNWYVHGSQGAETSLYYNGSEKLQTTNTGVDVTGSLDVSEFISVEKGAKIVIHNGINESTDRGIYWWLNTDTNWVTYMGYGGGNTPAGTTCPSIGSISTFALRNRVASNPGYGFIWENNSDVALMGLHSQSGNLTVAGDVSAVGNINAGSLSTSSNITLNNSASYHKAPTDAYIDFLVNGTAVDGNEPSSYSWYHGGYQGSSTQTGGMYMTLRYKLYTSSTWNYGVRFHKDSIVIPGYATATDFTATSDRSLKNNFQQIESPLKRLLNLKGYIHGWKAGGEDSFGFIHDEVEATEPLLAKRDELTNLGSVNYTKVVPLLVEAAREMKAEKDKEIAELKTECLAFKTRLEKLEKLLG